MKLKTPKQLGISRTQLRNIARITLFVHEEVKDENFDITTYYRDPTNGSLGCASTKGITYACGTAACFCGYGPLAGVKPRKDEDWGMYQARCFTSEWDVFSGPSTPMPVFSFLFSNEHLNSREAAVLRGAYFLMNGLPVESESMSYFQKRPFLEKWEAPTDFQPDWDAIKKAAK